MAVFSAKPIPPYAPIRKADAFTVIRSVFRAALYILPRTPDHTIRSDSFHRELYGDMAEPTVLFCSVPMLDIGREHNHAAPVQADGGFTLRPIPALTCRTEPKLPSAL